MQIDQDVDIHRTIYPYSRQGTLVPILTRGGWGKIPIETVLDQKTWQKGSLF